MSKNTERPAEFKFQINNGRFFSMRIPMPRCMHTCAEKLVAVYLKFRRKGVSCNLPGNALWASGGPHT